MSRKSSSFNSACPTSHCCWMICTLQFMLIGPGCLNITFRSDMPITFFISELATQILHISLREFLKLLFLFFCPFAYQSFLFPYTLTKPFPNLSLIFQLGSAQHLFYFIFEWTFQPQHSLFFKGKETPAWLIKFRNKSTQSVEQQLLWENIFRRMMMVIKIQNCTTKNFCFTLLEIPFNFELI